MGAAADASGTFGNGGATVDLSQSGGVSNNAMQFSAADAATLGAVAVAGYAAIATTGLGYGIAVTVATGVLARDDVGTAVCHAAHDIGVLGADPALADAPSIGMFGTEAAAIDAMNQDGGFGSMVALSGSSDSIWDASVGGNIAITDHIGGHSAIGITPWGYQSHDPLAGYDTRRGGPNHRDVRLRRVHSDQRPYDHDLCA